MNRRPLLGVLGIAGAGVGVGYAQLRASGREGRVFWRQMAVDAGGVPGSVAILTAWLEDDGSVSRTIHPAYAAAFEDGTRVSRELHRDLNRAFGADEPYCLVRYEARDCNGIPGDEGDDAVEVSRSGCNRLRVGDCVKR